VRGLSDEQASERVSTSHARLQRRDDVWVLADLGSTNGTFVDGERLAAETALAPGATVAFGDVAVLFEPLDDLAHARRPSGTPVVSGSLSPEEPGVETSAARPRRPIRVTPPRPGGPPAWLVTALVVVAAVAAYLLLR
jgi:pSer/pThr/pTyr-binding forkhead associated (FHA) protein